MLVCCRACCLTPHMFAGICHVEDDTNAYNTVVGQCPLQPTSQPISVVQCSASALTVEFSQTFKSTAVSWIATDCIDPADPTNQNANPTDPSNPTCSGCCSKRETVASNSTWQRTCRCKDGYATVAMYVHDGQIGADYGPLDDPVPSHCNPSSDTGQKCRFVYKISCENGTICTLRSSGDM